MYYVFTTCLLRIFFCLFLSRGCILEENVVVGGGTSIGANSFVSHSVIGKNCKIGNYTLITIQLNLVTTTAYVPEKVAIIMNLLL